MALKTGTVSFLRMENNTTDDAGSYTWTAYNVGFSGAIYKNGSYSAGLFDPADTLNYIQVTSAVTETIRTLQFWMYWPTGHGNVNKFFISNQSGATCAIQGENGSKLRMKHPSGWSGWSSAISDDTWTHVAMVTDGDGDEEWQLWIDNVEEVTVTSITSTCANIAWRIGASDAWVDPPTTSCDGYMDDVRLMTTVETSFPTVDPSGASGIIGGLASYMRLGSKNMGGIL